MFSTKGFLFAFDVIKEREFVYRAFETAQCLFRNKRGRQEEIDDVN